MIVSSQHALYLAGYRRVHFEIKCFFCVFLSEVKHLLMFNVQLCLTSERVSVTLKFSLCRRVELIMDATPSHMRY